jgi:ribosome maturation factor RimP
MAGKDALLKDLVAPVVQALGYDLWGIEYISQGKQSIVCVYIDNLGEGVDIDDCAQISRQISSVFDVEDPISGEYTLEVSSPGMDRRLFSLEQCNRYIGEQVKVRLRTAFEGRRNFSGQLTGVEGEDVVVAVDDNEYLLPFDQVEKASIVPRY